MEEEGDDAHSANDDEEPKQGDDGSDVDLISFHGHIVPHSQGITSTNTGKHDDVSACYI